MNVFRIDANTTDVVQELEEVLDKVSKFDPASTCLMLGLYLRSTNITPRILALLLQILNQPLPTLSTFKVSKWSIISFEQCRWPQLETTLPSVVDAERYCSPHDIYVFASLLVRRTVTLTIHDSPEILECLFQVLDFDSVNLSLHKMVLSALQCERFCDWVQRSLHLEHLSIDGWDSLDMEEPQMLVECLANRLHAPEPRVTESNRSTTYQQLGPAITDTVVRQGANDKVELSLPQSAPSRLKSLSLNGMNLEDCHFITLVEALPTSQLEFLDVNNNDIDYQGILAFAAQLPRIKCLKKVWLFNNVWENDEYDPEAYARCWAALLHGLTENYSIECLEPADHRDAPNDLITLYCYLNWAGRRLLATPSIVPLGLWPLVFERAGKEDKNCEVESRPADAIFLFLQQSSILSSIHSSHTLKNRRWKKHKIMA